MPIRKEIYILDLDETIWSSDPLFSWVWRAKRRMEQHDTTTSLCTCSIPLFNCLYSKTTQPTLIKNIKNKIKKTIMRSATQTNAQLKDMQQKQRRELLAVLFSAVDTVQNHQRNSASTPRPEHFNLPLFLSSLLNQDALQCLFDKLDWMLKYSLETIKQKPTQRRYFASKNTMDHASYIEHITKILTTPAGALTSLIPVGVINHKRINCLLNHIKKTKHACLTVSTAGKWKRDAVESFLSTIHDFNEPFSLFNASHFKQTTTYNRNRSNKFDTLFHYKMIETQHHSNKKFIVIDNVEQERQSIYSDALNIRFINPQEDVDFIQFGVIPSQEIDSKRAVETLSFDDRKSRLNQPLINKHDPQETKQYQSCAF